MSFRATSMPIRPGSAGSGSRGRGLQWAPVPWEGSLPNLRTSMTSAALTSGHPDPVCSLLSFLHLRPATRACPTLPRPHLLPRAILCQVENRRVPVTTIPALKGEEKYGSDSCGQPCPYPECSEQGRCRDRPPRFLICLVYHHQGTLRDLTL